MNTKRTIFWLGFIVVLGLIVWGLVVALNKPQSGTSVGKPAPITATDHVRGPDTAQVTLVEYGDFQCPACETYYPVVEQVLASSTVPIRYAYRHFPLPQHANAIAAAMASEAANAQGKFWEMFHMLFEHHVDWTELSDPTTVFLGYATKLGLNVSRFKTDLASSTLHEIIDADSNDGMHIGINQTPTFFVNGKAIVNPTSYDEFKTLIEQTASTTTH